MKIVNVTKNNRSRSFQELIVWQKAHEFVLRTYSFTKRLPKEEQDLISRFRSAAVGVAATISAGFKKEIPNERLRLFSQAKSDTEQCKYYLILLRDLSYGENDILNELADEITDLLNGYVSSTHSNLSFNF